MWPTVSVRKFDSYRVHYPNFPKFTVARAQLDTHRGTHVGRRRTHIEPGAEHDALGQGFFDRSSYRCSKVRSPLVAALGISRTILLEVWRPRRHTAFLPSRAQPAVHRRWISSDRDGRVPVIGLEARLNFPCIRNNGPAGA